MLLQLLQCYINIVIVMQIRFIVFVVVMYYDILTDFFDNPMIIVNVNVCQVRRQGCSIGTHGVLTKALSCAFRITSIWKKFCLGGPSEVM